VHISKNADLLATCVHNPLMAPPAPEMQSAYRSLYPFPEYQATCRGGDEDVPDYLIRQDADFHRRYCSIAANSNHTFFIYFLKKGRLHIKIAAY
jgi:hypothetical protein